MRQIKVFTNFQYHTEVVDVVRLYFADVVLTDIASDADIVHTIDNTTHDIVNRCQYGESVYTNTVVNCADLLHSVRLQKRYAKMCTYHCLVDALHIQQPWGALTGIRPTKLAYQIRDDEDSVWQDVFANDFGVSNAKVSLVQDILTQQNNLRIIDANSADMYIAIPFCKTRCSYCSFTSGEIGALSKYVPTYVDRLVEDIQYTQQLANSQGIRLNNLYFGGGTPTTLTAQQLDRVMSAVSFVPQEYTVEAGRPDTIDRDKLEVMAQHNVNRISINPQTFNDTVLKAIGRQHTGDDIIQCYHMARQYDFDINMDLIAGLPSESYDMFCNSIDTAIALNPDNITVHTLAVKHGSVLSQQEVTTRTHEVSQMVEYAHNMLYKAGYMPYYMYRQKYMSDNLENVGFCLPNKQCQYNINMMEETSNILACGANGISKRLFAQHNRIERSANAKDVITYNNNLSVYLDKKSKLYDYES